MFAQFTHFPLQYTLQSISYKDESPVFHPNSTYQHEESGRFQGRRGSRMSSEFAGVVLLLNAQLDDPQSDGALFEPQPIGPATKYMGELAESL